MYPMNDLTKSYVVPLYLKILHANFLKELDDEFVKLSKRACIDLRDKDLQRFLRMGWREAITASWIIALKKSSSFVDRLRENLLPSKWCFSGQFHLRAPLKTSE